MDGYLRCPTIYLFTSRCLFLELCLIVQHMTSSLAQEDVVQIKVEVTTNGTSTDTGKEASGIEEEVLGPLRVWHIMFIVSVILLVGLVVICCCYDFRVPRTRAEIEENFRKRMMNKQYLRVLERRPDELLRKQPAGARGPANSQQVPTVSQKVANRQAGPPPKPKPKPKPNTGYMTTAGNLGGPSEHSGANSIGDLISNKPRPKFGIQTPLAINPRDILALMKKNTTPAQQ